MLRCLDHEQSQHGHTDIHSLELLFEQIGMITNDMKQTPSYASRLR